MKSFYLLLIFFCLFISHSFSQTYYIDYQVRSDDLYARVLNDEFSEGSGNEEIVWKFKAKVSASIGSGSYSSERTITASGDYDQGLTYNQSYYTLTTGTCLNDADNIYVFIEGWEEDGNNDTFGTGDDDYRSDTDYDNNLSANTIGIWTNFNSNDNSGDYANAGTVGATNGDYRVEIDVWWNYTVPVVSCVLSNVSYGSLDISMSSGNYRVTSWEYEVSDDVGFSNIVSSGSTSNSTTTASGLAPLTQYWVRIKGTNEGGTGSYSSTQTATTTDDVSEPSGDGTEGNPYQIANITHLNWLVQTSSVWDKYFLQTADIDASGTSGWNSGAGISNIGNSTTAFTGSYDGGGYTISNLSNTSSLGSYAGFFGKTNNATIKNLGLTNVNYTASSNSGIFIGSAHETSVFNCYSTGAIDGHQSVGGIIGFCYTSSVSNCYSNATITASSEAGGLIGYTYSGCIVSNCYSTGSVTADGSLYGNTGGLIGYHRTSYVYHSYSTGAVSVVTGDVGGFIGRMSGTAEGCFWDTQTSGMSSGSGATGKTTSEMKTQSTFTNAGWDFTSPIWNIDGSVNNGYPNIQNNSIENLWIGNSNSSWSNTSNWSKLRTPDSSEDIIITDINNDPIISSNADCKNITVNNGASLTINSGGSLITSGTIANNGTINIEHSMSDNYWHLVSSPISNATANIFYGDYLQYFDESLSENNYIDISNENTPLTPCKGFAWRNYNKSDFTFTGTPNNGEKSIAITANNVGWNLVGNPYPSSIDWNELNGTYGAVYLWDPTADAGTGDYIEWNGSTEYGIAPMQAFFIYTDVNTSFTVNNNVRTHHNADTYYKSTDSEIQNGIVLSTNNSDQLTIRLLNDAHNEFDLIYDAFKIISLGEANSQLYSIYFDSKFAIDCRPDSELIQLGYQNNSNGTYSIEKIAMDGISIAELEDTKINRFHDLSKGAYSFDWEATDSEERFILHLKATGIEDIEAQDVQVYAANGQLYVRIDDVDEFDKIMVYDLAGRLVLESSLSHQNLQSFNTSHIHGAYLIQLNGKIKTRTKKVVLN